MISGKAILSTLGVLLLFLGGALLLPMLIGLLYAEPRWWSFGVAALIALVLGGVMRWRFGEVADLLKAREGFAVVALAWLVLSLVGALPFVFSGVLDSYTDAFFETMSGFTTTGATILGGAGTPPIESLPPSLLFWRSLTHWMGGMGIIVLTLAVMPVLGIGGMQLYKAEVPGLAADKLTPRIGETAKLLWLIYLGLTTVEFLMLWPAMGWFDAINHAFSTMATGGFSTENGSLGQYESAYIEWVVIVFMTLGGINFALHFRLLRGQFVTVWKDTEVKVYLGIVGISTLLLFLVLWSPLQGTNAGVTTYAGVEETIRVAAFQVIAILTTTGFGTADYELWPPFAISVLFLLFFVGGMAGSTAGGMKVIRHVLLIKNSFAEIKQLIHPNAVIHVRLNGHVMPPEIMRSVLSFFVLYFGLIGIGTLLMAAMGLDLLSAFSVTISSIGNVGPAFSEYGPTESYASIPAAGKWLLSLLMMTGRLELFTVLVLFSSFFWRR